MEGHVFRGEQGGRAILRSYVLGCTPEVGFQDMFAGNSLMVDRYLEGGLSPYRIRWSFISEPTREKIESGEAHINWGEFRDGGYQGTTHIGNVEFYKFMYSGARGSEGWGGIGENIREGLRSGRGVVTMLPGEEAEEFIPNFFGPYLEQSGRDDIKTP